jgi:hypothetical protein
MMDPDVAAEIEKLKESFTAEINKLGEAFNDLIVKFAALTAVVGAMAERDPPREKRVIAWIQAIEKSSETQSQNAILRVALGLLSAPEAPPADTESTD